VKASTFFPYILSQDEIRWILATASAHEGHFRWASMLRRLVLVLYCTGLRLGVATRLQMTDVDLERGTLTIRNSKRRTRIVPMRDDLVRELRRYVEDRRQLLIDQRRVDPGAMFVRRNGPPLLPTLSAGMLRHLGIKPAHGRTGARPTSSAMPSRCIASRSGRGKAPIYTPSSPCCRPISAIRTSSVPRLI
jgi:integrase/recombinase XerD